MPRHPADAVLSVVAARSVPYKRAVLDGPKDDLLILLRLPHSSLLLTLSQAHTLST
jgi:hypothetical protein